MFLADPTKGRTYKGAKPKGVGCRNTGLKWIRENVHDGVLYFADDDNTYDLDLFKEVTRHSFSLECFMKLVKQNVII